jgi:hypothetical protein
MKLKWTECGLPWYVIDKSEAPLRPDLTKRIRAEFADYKSVERTDAEKYEYMMKIKSWWDQQPEVKVWRDKYVIWKLQEQYKSFVGRGLNKPGTVIVVDTPHGEKMLIIGHINKKAGTSEDHSEFPAHTIIKRYAVIDLNGVKH